MPGQRDKAEGFIERGPMIPGDVVAERVARSRPPGDLAIWPHSVGNGSDRIGAALDHMRAAQLLQRHEIDGPFHLLGGDRIAASALKLKEKVPAKHTGFAVIGTGRVDHRPGRHERIGHRDLGMLEDRGGLLVKRRQQRGGHRDHADGFAVDVGPITIGQRVRRTRSTRGQTGDK